MELFSPHEVFLFYIFQGTLKFGMVVETSEFSSGDESSDDEDQVKPGTVRVAWYPSGKEEVLSEKKLNLSDRSPN